MERKPWTGNDGRSLERRSRTEGLFRADLYSCLVKQASNVYSDSSLLALKKRLFAAVHFTPQNRALPSSPVGRLRVCMILVTRGFVSGYVGTQVPSTRLYIYHRHEPATSPYELSRFRP